MTEEVRTDQTFGAQCEYRKEDPKHREHAIVIVRHKIGTMLLGAMRAEQRYQVLYTEDHSPRDLYPDDRYMLYTIKAYLR